MNLRQQHGFSQQRSFTLIERSYCRRMSGVTLLELLTVITIVGILMAIGVPAYRTVTNSSRIAAEVNGLLGDLQFARAEAIKEGQTVTVCVSADGANCTNSTNWQSGWIVFSNPNGNAVVDGGETVLRAQAPFTNTDTFQSTNNVAAVTFNREGFATGIAAGALIKLHDATNNSTWTRCLAITRVGLMATELFGATFNGFACS